MGPDQVAGILVQVVEAKVRAKSRERHGEESAGPATTVAAAAETNTTAGGEARTKGDAAQGEQVAKAEVHSAATQYKIDPKLLKTLDERMQGVSNATDMILQTGEARRGPQSSLAVQELQEKMAAFDRDLVLDAVRLIHEKKIRGEADVVRIAFDGRYGDATQRAVALIQEKLELPVTGGVTREFLARLDEAILIKATRVAEVSAPAAIDAPLAAATTATTESDVKQAAEDVERCVKKGETREGETLGVVLERIQTAHGSEAVRAVASEFAREVGDHSVTVPGDYTPFVRRITESTKLSPEEMASAIDALYPGRYHQSDLVAAASLQAGLMHVIDRYPWKDKKMVPLVEACRREDGTLSGAGEAFVDMFGWHWKERSGGSRKVEADKAAFLDSVVENVQSYGTTLR